MILLEGKPVAEEVKSELREAIRKLSRAPRLAIVVVGANSVSASFVTLKERFASEIGAETKMYEFETDRELVVGGNK